MMLALIAGYVDTLGFVALFGLFTAHITGNFVLIGSELVHAHNGVIIKLLAFPAFIAGVVLTRVLAIRMERAQHDPQALLFRLQALLLIGFMAAGMWAGPRIDPHALSAILAGMLGAMAMGIQNAGSRLVLTQLSPTTVMTGNVTQLIIDLVDWAHNPSAPGVRERIQKFGWPILAFGLGALGGATAFNLAGFPALALPAGMLMLLSAPRKAA
ncbi:MAG: DUF1275 domain-containing protein [Burkholderiales bacterium]|nr:DUF1275 domain-containing protein [Burkholderiales bacterium]